jgi:hypothetical protein
VTCPRPDVRKLAVVFVSGHVGRCGSEDGSGEGSDDGWPLHVGGNCDICVVLTREDLCLCALVGGGRAPPVMPGRRQRYQ